MNCPKDFAPNDKDLTNMAMHASESSLAKDWNSKEDNIWVLPADNPKEIGWTVNENIGIGIVNTWIFLPLWKKIWYRRFWRDLFYKIFSRKRVNN